MAVTIYELGTMADGKNEDNGKKIHIINVGPAVTFRTDINYNFELIRTWINNASQDIQGLSSQVTNLNTKVDSIIAGGAGIDIQLSKTQPSKQKKGDYWFKIL